MAHLLRLERNGEYISLVASPYRTLNYTPATPNISTVDAISEIEDGGERPLVTRRNVTEAIELYIQPALAAASAMNIAQDAIHALETWLLYAEQWQNSRAGYPLYIEFQPEGTTGVWRSEVLSGKLELENSGMTRWASGKAVKALLVLYRRFYWEGAETELPLSNGNGTNVTGGIAIVNHDDAGAGDDNWVTISGASVTGVLPAPIKLKIENTNNTPAVDDRNFYIGQNLWAGAITHVLEGETTPPDVTDIADAGCSNGYYRPLPLSTSVSFRRTWTLTSAELAKYAGRNYRLFVRLDTGLAASTVYGYFALRITGTSLLVARTPEINLANNFLFDFGVLPIPPWLPGAAAYQSLDLDVVLYDTDTVTPETLNFDCVFLVPTDGYRALITDGYPLDYQEYIIDDGPANKLYIDGASGVSGNYVGYGGRIKVWPGKDTTIYFLSTHLNGADIDRAHEITIWYRPRRLTI